MSPLFAGALALAADPSPNPTEGQLRPGLESWQVSPGLVGFLVTFVLALACVLLFLNMSKHLRRAGHNARQQGLPVPEPEVISFSRPGEGAEGDGPDAGTGGASAPDGDGADGAGSGSTKGGGGSVG
ncbi:hypothetical protein [Promicromonospora sp. NPDC090134]|uniref:hypothetical protein n=1 Tax=Promicromonospora sp. NPDC090134 TaxID=3364408 RepID=UPI00382B03E7